MKQECPSSLPMVAAPSIPSSSPSSQAPQRGQKTL